jgi:hypothetical protein
MDLFGREMRDFGDVVSVHVDLFRLCLDWGLYEFLLFITEDWYKDRV